MRKTRKDTHSRRPAPRNSSERVQKQARHPKPQLQRPTEHLIIGRNALFEVLRHAPERILYVYIAGRGAISGDRRNAELIDDLRQKRIEVREVTTESLTSLCGSDAHQSFVAFLKERQPIDLAQFIEKTRSKEICTVVALDSILDPHNIGAIMRAAECFGADGVLWSKNRGGEVSAAVSKTSAGASELITQVVVSNLVESLRKLKDAGFWIVAAQSGSSSVDLGSFVWPKRSVIVLGSEGSGLHRLVSENCDFSVQIPLIGRIESLNVSQAAGIMLFARGVLGRN